MKRMFTLLLFALLCLALSTALAETQRTTIAQDGIEYVLQDGQAYPHRALPDVEIITLHARPGGYPLATTLLSGAHSLNMTAHTLVIEEGVTDLDWVFFTSGESLRWVQLPSTLLLPEKNLFTACPNIEAYTVAAGNPYIKDVNGILFSADGRTLLRYPAARAGAYAIPDGVEQIHPRAFAGCAALTELTIPAGLPGGALGIDLVGCSALLVLHLPADMTRVDSRSVADCRSLTRIEVEEGNPHYFDLDGVLFDRAFPNRIHTFPRSWGTAYDVPEQVTVLEKGTFEYNTLLQTITLPRGLTEIPDNAFYRCSALERVNLPIGLTSIGASAFEDCIGLTTITLPPGLTSLGFAAFQGCTGLTEITIPAGITDIPAEAFSQCWSLAQVNLPETLRTIDMYAFSGCGQLASITLPASLENIGFMGFSGYEYGIAFYCAYESPGYWYALSENHRWATPGGIAEAIELPPSPRAVIVNLRSATDTLPLREKASESARELARYQNGTTAVLLDEAQGGWCRVTMPDGRTGFFPADQLVAMDDLTQFVLPAWAQAKDGSRFIAYAQPDESQPLPSQSGDSTRMRVLYQVGSWYRLLLDTQPVYVPTRDVKIAIGTERRAHQGIGYAVVTNDKLQDRLHLRAEPNQSAASLGRFFSGTQVVVLDYVSDVWAHVQMIDGQTGYMMRFYLTDIYSEEGELFTG
ncbi:MAG: leucine-rich repeat protein [Oscillospiraceae bacterium]|jgi:uncharacterized protein YgiM (DUF1202 family)|nr:leucine-rich repeat protein [Oscillospiraceae bacterium]